MSILLIGGSPARDSRSGRLLQHIGAQLTQRGFLVDTLYIRDLPAEALLHADFKDPAIVAANARVAHAEGVVIATPIYKAAYSGLLKAFLDLLPQFGLEGKIVLPIASGGSAAHTLALDYALRPVLASLYPKQILDSIYAVEHQISYSDETGLSLDPAIEERVSDGIGGLVRTLHQPLTSNEPFAA